jgi:hypothetical protein
MSWKETGLYFQLLALQFKHGAIPAEPKLCARMLGVGVSGPDYEDFEAAFEAVAPEFDPVENDPSKLRNARQAKERAKAVAKIKQKIAAGRASGKSRRSNKNERPLNDRSNVRSTDDATLDVDVDIDSDLEETEQQRVPSDVDGIVDVVNEHREAAGMTLLRGGDRTGRGYVRARIRDHGLEAVEAVARYAPADSWIRDGDKFSLSALFSPKSFPLLLDRMENQNRNGGLSAGDKKIIDLRKRLEAVEL